MAIKTDLVSSPAALDSIMDFENHFTLKLRLSKIAISLFEVWRTQYECTVWFGCIHTNLPKPCSVVAMCPPYFKKAYGIPGLHKTTGLIILCQITIEMLLIYSIIQI